MIVFEELYLRAEKECYGGNQLRIIRTIYTVQGRFLGK